MATVQPIFFSFDLTFNLTRKLAIAVFNYLSRDKIDDFLKMFAKMNETGSRALKSKFEWLA